MKLLRKIALILVIATSASTGIVAGLVYAPGSPGIPYLSPTFQADKATFRQQSTDQIGAIYEVWYVQPKTSETNTSLIIVLAANHPATHFYGVSTEAASSTYGNFSVSASINNEKTWLLIPAATCPSQPDPNYTELVVLRADSPQGEVDFSFNCTQNLGTIVLGNPHIIVPRLVHSSSQTCTDSLTLDSAVFSNNNDSVTLNIRNSGTCDTILASYYVKDPYGNAYAKSSWTGPTISQNSLESATILIGSACTGCGLTGTAFTFQSGTSYSILIVTSHNVQFQFNVTRQTIAEALSVDSYVFTSSGTNVTLYIRNLGAGATSLQSYYVKDSSGNSWNLQNWNVGPINPNNVLAVNVAIGSASGGCGSACVYTGTPNAFNTFVGGNSYTIIIVTYRNNVFQFTVTRTVIEALNLEFSGFNCPGSGSCYNVTLNIRNTGSVTVSFVTYYVTDPSGNSYARLNWATDTGPNKPPAAGISPGALGVFYMNIGTGVGTSPAGQCGSSCTLTGTAFAFASGTSYTVKIVTGRGNQFTFTVTR